MPYSSSLTAQEWEIIEPLLPKKKKLNLQIGQRGKFSMGSLINSKTVVIGVIYPRIFLLTLQSIGMTNSGETKV